MNDVPHRVEFANTLRGLAALCVLISHYLYIFWMLPDVVADLIKTPPLSVTMPTYLGWMMLLPQFNWGAFGVALFFLISGFVIPFSLRNVGWHYFLLGRLFRIWPLYAVAFSLTLLTLVITTGVYGIAWPFSINEVVIHYFPGLRELLWSTSIDGIIWTLDIEVKFYLVCAIGAVAIRRKSSWIFVAPVILACLALYLLSRAPIWLELTPDAYRIALGISHPTPFIIFMFIGTTFYYVHANALRPDQGVVVGTGLFLLAFIVIQSGLFAVQMNQAWSYGLAVLTFATASSYPRLFKSRPLTDFFAAISYPLWAVHGVAGYVSLHFMIANGWPAWLSLIVTMAGAITLAWVLHVTVEIPSQRLGRTLTHRPLRGTAVAAVT